MSVSVADPQTLRDGVREIARGIAAQHADDVDRQGRFPQETIDALRDAGALGAFVPGALGGGGVSLRVLAECCQDLAGACASSAMVLAMHQIKVTSLTRHLDPGSYFESFLAEVAADGRLIASVTSEIGTGGDMGRSIAAVSEAGGGLMQFEKQAPTVSYGLYADDLFTTVRRSPEAEPGDQVVVVTRREQNELEPAGTWDVLGMRGTCSPGFTLRARFPAEQIVGTPFSRVATESMVPISHILWSHVWLGIAEDAFGRARAFVRAAAKRKPGGPLPAAQRLSHLMSELSLLRAEVSAALTEFEAADREPGRPRLSNMSTILRFNNLKIAASEKSAEVCRGALEVCGIMGFKNDTPFSVGRNLRDAMSGALMIANERIHDTNAGLLLIAKDV
ncbi:MAG TPA: acyl-CoA dehydrogenase family protein [Solirubrobacteraceae bacterium]|nr:acyl-CoA dehydrogenase family protein [Solirubrobacteraceae bacterium]